MFQHTNTVTHVQMDTHAHTQTHTHRHTQIHRHTHIHTLRHCKVSCFPCPPRLTERHNHLLFSHTGAEMQSWLWKNISLNGAEAESTVTGLMRVGLLDCLTSDVHLSPFSEQHYYRLVRNTLGDVSTVFFDVIGKL